MPRVLLVCVLLAAARLFAAESAPAPVNAYARQALSLNGAWRIIIDPYDNGYFNYRRQPHDASPNPTAGYFLDRQPADRSELLEYNFATSPTLLVPRDWNSQDARLLYYEGSLWYRRTFDFTPSMPDRRVFVYFGGANYETDVYLNGQKLGHHVGGFTPFAFEVTGLLRPTGNSLVARVNNQRHADGVPTDNTDWWNYGGLTRDVMILETPAAFIRDYFLQLKPGAADRVAGYVQLDGARGAQPVKIEIPELHVSTDATTDAAGRAAIEFALKGAELWSPENPRRYEVILSAGVDTPGAAGADRLSEQIGFRTIATRGTDILLNGKPVFLRGICLHEENPLRGGRATTPADDRLLLTWAKELGCNYVRLAHYPHNEHMARLADEMGLLLWEEVPVYWTIHWENPDTFANAANQLTELITRDKNRASVIIWSLANETPVTPARTEFLTKEAALARRLDPTRLISAAMERSDDPADPNVRHVKDPLADVVDIVSFNEYIGWYTALPDDCAKTRWVIEYNKPVLISEFGADAAQGLHGDRLTRFSEEFQEDFYRQSLAMLTKIPQLRGMTPWILCDFRSPRRPLPGVQDGWNRKGLIGENGTKKKAFHVLQKFYAEKAAEAAR